MNRVFCCSAWRAPCQGCLEPRSKKVMHVFEILADSVPEWKYFLLAAIPVSTDVSSKNSHKPEITLINLQTFFFLLLVVGIFLSVLVTYNQFVSHFET